jgi:hypothetical protein
VSANHEKGSSAVATVEAPGGCRGQGQRAELINIINIYYLQYAKYFACKGAM